MMKQINKYYVPLIALTLTFSAHAASYNQTIQLHVTPKDDATPSSIILCFETTDLFDGKHCGYGATNHYSHGAKNWHFFEYKFIYPYERHLSTDISCYPLLSDQYRGRTPQEDGKLDIYADMSSKRTFTSGGRLVEEVVTYSNCKTVWTPGKL